MPFHREDENKQTDRSERPTMNATSSDSKADEESGMVTRWAWVKSTRWTGAEGGRVVTSFSSFDAVTFGLERRVGAIRSTDPFLVGVSIGDGVIRWVLVSASDRIPVEIRCGIRRWCSLAFR